MIAKLFEVNGRQVVYIRRKNENEEIEITVECPEGSILAEFRSTLSWDGDYTKADIAFDSLIIDNAVAAINACDKFHEENDLLDADYKESLDSLKKD